MTTTNLPEASTEPNAAAPTRGLTAAVWSAVIFVFPITLLAAILLIPNLIELIERLLLHPKSPRLPMLLMALVQIALLLLPTATILSWRHDRRGTKFRYRMPHTLALAWITFGLGLLAYLWAALMLAAFPD